MAQRYFARAVGTARRGFAAETATYEGLKLSRPSPGVALLELNRPQQLNAMNDKFWSEYKRAVTDLSHDASVRACVVSGGESKHFSCGLDLADPAISEMMMGVAKDGAEVFDPAREAFRQRAGILRYQAAFSAMVDAPQPWIAAVDGACIGGAIDLLSSCDVRYASETSVFSIAEVNVGLAADVGTLQRLPKLVGNASDLAELALTGRRFSAAEARTLGMVGALYPDRAATVAAALETAALISSKSPVAVVGTKRFLHYARDHSAAQSLEYTATWNAAMLQSPDLAKAGRAFKEKTTPTFDDVVTHDERGV